MDTDLLRRLNTNANLYPLYGQYPHPDIFPNGNRFSGLPS